MGAPALARDGRDVATELVVALATRPFRVLGGYVVESLDRGIFAPQARGTSFEGLHPPGA